MVLNRHKPQALLVHLDDDTLLSEPGIRRALATALSGTKACLLATPHSLPVSRLEISSAHLSRVGIPVVRGTTASVHEDTEVITAWAERLVAADASPLIGLAVAGRSICSEHCLTNHRNGSSS